MYNIYLRSPEQAITDQTRTSDKQAALAAFAVLIERTEFDGTRMCAILNFQNIALAHHRFWAEPGNDDYWRGRVDQLGHSTVKPFPYGAADGRPITVFLDGATLALAEKLGRGDAAEGVRRAMKNLSGVPEVLRGVTAPARPGRDDLPDACPEASGTCGLAPR